MNQLFVVGIGPGDVAALTRQAESALAKADILFGYTLYIDLIARYFPGKPTFSTPMKSERERCLLALQRAAEGQIVAMICSGDAGVYGMASLLLELSPQFPEVDIKVIPGVTAALSGGALVGAPLSHDFCVVSLSDLLTPWALIEKRIACAAEGDFALCLYNPASKKRSDYLQKACDILLRYQSPETVCAVTRNIGREGQSHKLLTLSALRDEPVDMFCTVFIGNSQTRRIGDRMVTPRGYANG